MSLSEVLRLPALKAAPRLLGARLTTNVNGETTTIRVTEVEAYGGADDPASHAYRGRTPRNAAMFLGGGHLYCYLSYGLHVCANVVVGEEGDPGAVLLRAGVPVAGGAIMERRRGRAEHLADGPGKLAQAMGIALEHDGLPLSELVELTLTEDSVPFVTTPRVGITRAADRPWRFAQSARS